MNGPWFAAILAASVAVGYLLTGITQAARRRYRGRHRMHTPGPAHPAWLEMQRIIDDAEIAAEVNRGMAAIDQLLEEHSR